MLFYTSEKLLILRGACKFQHINDKETNLKKVVFLSMCVDNNNILCYSVLRNTGRFSVNIFFIHLGGF